MPGAPKGVAADVTVRYRTQVEPRPAPADDDEINQLALDTDNPPDPLSEFLETWANYVGYNCMVLRLPDPSTRRMPGQTYVRPHFGQPEQLGAVTFDSNPINFISSLQIVNGGSGGCFQIWLMNHAGGRVQDAVLYSVSIADPPRQQPANAPVAALQQQQQYQPPQRSESERKLEEAKDRLFNHALERALAPPPPAGTGGNNNGLTAEDNAKLFLLGQTNFLDGIFGNMAELAKKAASVSEPSAPTLKDRALDAAVDIVTKNPAIIDRLSSTAERILARLLPDPRLDVMLPPPSSQPVNYQPPPQPQAQPAPAATDNLPDELDNPDDEDDETMDILDRLIVLFNSNEPLNLNSPVVAELVKDYPIKAKIALRMIAAQPLDDIIEWIKDTGGELYASLLDGPASGPYLRQRLGEFKQVCEAARQQVQEKADRRPATEDRQETEKATDDPTVTT